MLSIEYIIGWITECDFRGAHLKEFFVLPLRLVKHELNLSVIDGLQLIQAVYHNLPLRLRLHACLLASHRPLDALLWQHNICAPGLPCLRICWHGVRPWVWHLTHHLFWLLASLVLKYVWRIRLSPDVLLGSRSWRSVNHFWAIISRCPTRTLTLESWTRYLISLP
jgi:hypothetical protein